jgi:hypothetical protein
MIIYLSLLVALIGLVMYLVCGNPPNPGSQKAAEVGRIMFFAGLLAFLLLTVSGHALTLLR